MIRHCAAAFSGLLMTALLAGGCATIQPGPTVSDAAAARAYAAGDYARAASRYAAYLEDRPADPNAWFRLGTALAHQGELRNAQHALETTLGLDPEYARARYNLGLVHIQLGWRALTAARQDAPGRFDDAAATAYLSCLLQSLRAPSGDEDC